MSGYDGQNWGVLLLDPRLSALFPFLGLREVVPVLCTQRGFDRVFAAVKFWEGSTVSSRRLKYRTHPLS